MIFGRSGYGRGGGGGGGRLMIAVIIAIIGLVGYFMKPKVTNPETGETYRVALSVDQEKALGLEAAREMIPKLGGALDPRSNPEAGLVDEVGRRLVQRSGASGTDYAGNFNFYLVNDPDMINAFALPGGQIAITRGLFDRLETEAQLAGVLGHEVGHVIAQHSARQMAKGQLGQMLATAVAVGASGEGGRGQAAGMAAVMAQQMLTLSYGREHERQSDEIGLKYMMQAGYHPEGMLGVMNVLAEASKGNRQPQFMSSHPHPETRIETIKRFLQENREQIERLELTYGRRLRR